MSPRRLADATLGALGELGAGGHPAIAALLAAVDDAVSPLIDALGPLGVPDPAARQAAIAALHARWRQDPALVRSLQAAATAPGPAGALALQIIGQLSGPDVPDEQAFGDAITPALDAAATTRSAAQAAVDQRRIADSLDDAFADLDFTRR